MNKLDKIKKIEKIKKIKKIEKIKKIDKKKIGIVICTLNCKDMLELCLASVAKQDYPKELIRVYCSDSDSTDGTLEVIDRYEAILIPHVPKGYMEQVGGPKSLGVDRAIADGCDYIFTIDSDNAFVETDWLRKMIMPLELDPELRLTICRMAIVKEDKMINQICSYTGTDTFATYKSLDPLITMNKIPLVDCGDYWTYEMKPNNFKIFGGYYVCYRAKTIEEIGGHYMRDVDNGITLARKGICKLAIPKNCTIHHRQASAFWNHIKKKLKWARYYFKEGHKDRKFNWTENKSEFYLRIIVCLLFIPDFITSLKMMVKYKNKSWILYAPLSFFTTIAYLWAYLESKFQSQQAQH